VIETHSVGPSSSPSSAALVQPLPPILEVRNLTRRFGGLVAVNEVSFSVAPGSVHGLIGPNGAGKTTCFNLIAGVLDASAGEVLLDGMPVTGEPAYRRARLGMARTFQNLQIFRELTVLENVMLGLHVKLSTGWLGALAGRARSDGSERHAASAALEALDRVGLGKLAMSPASQLSFGQCKVLEIARALVGSPRLLLLDEPTAGLPHENVVEVEGIIRELCTMGVTVLLVEHNMGLVMRVCNEIVVLDHGERIAAGSPDQIRVHPAVVEAYLGKDSDS
jgi:branched-chain amino acid transport system ATP-binding protein